MLTRNFVYLSSVHSGNCRNIKLPFLPKLNCSFAFALYLSARYHSFGALGGLNHSHTCRQVVLLHWNSEQASETLKWRQPASARQLLIMDAITPCLHYVVSWISVLFVIFSAYSLSLSSIHFFVYFSPLKRVIHLQLLYSVSYIFLLCQKRNERIRDWPHG